MMRSISTLVCGTVLVLSSFACGASPAAPTSAATPAPTSSGAVNLTGTWNGTLSDTQGAAMMTWTLTQTGASVAGTAITRPMDPADGTCASCHKNKIGTLSGTISGTTLMLTMTFPGARDDEPTPICSVTLSGAAPNIADDGLAGTYAGADSCEGPFADGRMTLARQR